MPPLFCRETKTTKGEWTKQEQCKTYHNDTGNGWSSAKVFKGWLLKVFVKHVAFTSIHKMREVWCFSSMGHPPICMYTHSDDGSLHAFTRRTMHNAHMMLCNNPWM